MVIVNLIGGLGNQMFQYACGKAISLKNGVPLYIYINNFSGYNFHNGFELNKVFPSINFNVIPFNIYNDLVGIYKYHYIQKIVSILPFNSRNFGNCIFENRNLSFCSEISSISTPIYIHGYWQSQDYFYPYFDVIRDEFQFSNPLSVHDNIILDSMKSSKSVSLHIRRGDYTSSPNNNIYYYCDIEYYRRAISVIKKTCNNFKIYVFTDSSEITNDELSRQFGEEVFLVNHNRGVDSYNDMRLMSAADYNIIANSSFSWWAAWLNPNPNKIVIGPRHWFNDGNRGHNIMPSSWIKV